MTRKIDMTGRAAGRWTVLGEAPTERGCKQRWVCRCECGTISDVIGADLRNGKSGGCRSCQGSTHGHARRGHESPTYISWMAMIGRTGVRGGAGLPRYKGVVFVCKRWLTYENFLQDMGERPSESSIDRIDSSGHYSCGECDECITNGWPRNCRWSTQKQQVRNIKSNRILEHAGDRLCVAEWAERLGVSKNTILARLRYGWSVRRALTEPVHNVGRRCSKITAQHSVLAE